jgi:hypothetical protein
MVKLMLCSLLAAVGSGDASAVAAGAGPEVPATAAPPTADPPAATPPGPPPSTAAEERKKLEERIARELGAEAQPFPGATLGPPPAEGAPADAASARGGIPMGKLMLIPDIAVVVDGALGFTNLAPAQQAPAALILPQHRLEPLLQEVELALQATVDPYVRGDVFLTFTSEGVEVEEAYLTTLSLPWGLQVKAGKIYSPFGRIGQLHRHQWTFIEQPLSMQRLEAPEGLGGAGGDVAWLAPLPWFVELHGAYQATAPGFASGSSQLTGVARLVQFVELSDGATLGVGLSWATFQSELPDQWKNLGGADLYLKLRNPASRAYWILQGEAFWRQLASQVLGNGTWGGYGQVVWRLDRSWDLGVRYDHAPAEGTAGPGAQQTWTAHAGYSPSEFFRVRLDPSFVQLPRGVNGFRALASFEFTLGVHGAHPF